MFKQRAFAIVIILISLGLLIPGVTQPILTISGTIDKAQLTQAGIDQIALSLGDNSKNGSTRAMISMVSGLLGLNNIEGELEVFKKTRSIWGTVNELYQSGNAMVAGLVMLFSVLVPAIKLSLMLIQQLPVSRAVQHTSAQITHAIAKWSMADVFVVAVMVTYMAGNASANMGQLLQTQAKFEIGFYYFVGYCLLAVFSRYLYPAKP